MSPICASSALSRGKRRAWRDGGRPTPGRSGRERTHRRRRGVQVGSGPTGGDGACSGAGGGGGGGGGGSGGGACSGAGGAVACGRAGAG